MGIWVLIKVKNSKTSRIWNFRAVLINWIMKLTELNLQFKIRATNTKLTKWKFEKLYFPLDIVRYPNLPELARCYPILPEFCRSTFGRFISAANCWTILLCIKIKRKKRVTCSGGWKQQPLNFFQRHRLSVMISVRTMRSILHTSSRTPKWRSSLPVSASRKNDNVG